MNYLMLMKSLDFFVASALHCLPVDESNTDKLRSNTAPILLYTFLFFMIKIHII